MNVWIERLNVVNCCVMGVFIVKKMFVKCLIGSDFGEFLFFFDVEIKCLF